MQTMTPIHPDMFVSTVSRQCKQKVKEQKSRAQAGERAFGIYQLNFYAPPLKSIGIFET